MVSGMKLVDVVIISIKAGHPSSSGRREYQWLAGVYAEFGTHHAATVPTNGPSLASLFGDGDQKNAGSTFSMTMVKAAFQMGEMITRPHTELVGVSVHTGAPTLAPTETPEGAVRSVDGIIAICALVFVLVAAIVGCVVWMACRIRSTSGGGKFQRVAMVPEIEPSVELGSSGQQPSWSVHSANPWKDQMAGGTQGSYADHVAAKRHESSEELHHSRF